MEPEQPVPELSANNPANNPERLSQLISAGQASKRGRGAWYSKFIRRLRLILPVIALAMIAVVFTWNSHTAETFAPPVDNPAIPKTAGKNELLNPRFENTDAQGQSYTLSAKRAVQDEKDEKIVLLETPRADLKLNSGGWVSIQSIDGAFEQSRQKLLLRGDVRLFRDGGYELATSELHIDMKNNEAISDTPVSAQGPEGTLEAMGLRGNNTDGSLVFTGPIKLVLFADMFGKDKGGLF